MLFYLGTAKDIYKYLIQYKEIAFHLSLSFFLPLSPDSSIIRADRFINDSSSIFDDSFTSVKESIQMKKRKSARRRQKHRKGRGERIRRGRSLQRRRLPKDTWGPSALSISLLLSLFPEQSSSRRRTTTSSPCFCHSC